MDFKKRKGSFVVLMRLKGVSMLKLLNVFIQVALHNLDTDF
jgi:hypothetical protein